MSDNNNEYLAYLCDRVQKITDAVYRVTDLLTDKEPLKWEIRERALILFTDLVSLKRRNDFERTSFLAKLENLIEEIIPLLSLIKGRFSISGANFEILKDEYMAVKDIISKEREKKIFLEMSPIIEPPQISNGQESNGHDIGQESNGQKIDKFESPTITLRLKPSIEERKKKLLGFIREKQKVSIGEIAGVFKEFGGKTIQRDLLEMVEKGILRKEGDKRWRIYVFNV